MSEKKFFEIDYDGIYYIVDSSKLKRKKEDFEDKEDFEQYCLGNAVIQIVNLLNEQQAIIDGLKEKLCELGVSDIKINGKRINTGLEEWLE